MITCVVRVSTFWTRSCVSVGFLRKSFTMAVNNCSCTCEFSSWKPSKKLCNNSSALSIRSAYSPMIHIIEARASGSSSESKFSHNVDIIFSYLFGYFLNMSFILFYFLNHIMILFYMFKCTVGWQENYFWKILLWSLRWPLAPRSLL